MSTIVKHTALYVWVAAFAFAVQWVIQEPQDISKMLSSMVFLLGIYLLFYYLFVLALKKRKELGAFIFLGMMTIKMALVISFILFFLNPKKTENNVDILLFLISYFALLIADLSVKVKILKS